MLTRCVGEVVVLLAQVGPTGLNRSIYAGTVSNWLGSWLAGSASAPEPDASAESTSVQRHRGERLGLPAAGPGSVASLGRRLGAFVLDCLMATLITSMFVHPRFMRTETMQTLNYWSVLTWLLITVISTSFFGFTPGMAVFGIRVARLDGASLLGPVRGLVRALLVALLIPAVVWDVDRRGLHDRAVGTVVVKLR